MLKVSASAIAGAAVLGPEAFAKSDSAEMTESRKVLVIGGHPDDPETACGVLGVRPVFLNQIGQFRGVEFHCKRAEAFVHLRRSNSDIL